jgi:purine-binding chemotaxis protein CheW
LPRKRKTEPVAAPDAALVPEPVAEPVECEPSEKSIEIALTQAVMFTMEGQLFALPIEAVQEIQQIVEFTAVRGTAPALVGVIDLRGSVVPLIDLRVLLGIAERPYHLETPLVFARLGERLVALIVDEVHDVIDLTGTQLQAPSRLYALADHLIGVARRSDGLLFVLDPDGLVPAEALPTVNDAVIGGER